jgi:Flp pilus assembly protein TadG
MIGPMSRMIRRFRRDQRGVSAVEFAFIAPILIVFYFGMAEVTQAIIAQRRTIGTASGIGDLVAQANGSITASNVDDIMNMSSVLMYPYPLTGSPGPLQICIYSILSDPSTGKKTIDWFRAKNESATTCSKSDTSISSLSAGVIAPGQSLIMARVKYTYTPTTQIVIGKLKPLFTRTYYLRPRRSVAITCADC